MTDQQKRDELVLRAPHLAAYKDDPEFFSIVVLLGYMQYLVENGFVENGFKFPSKARGVLALCQEYDVQPSLETIMAFVDTHVDGDGEMKFKIAVFLTAMSKDFPAFKNKVEQVKRSL